MRDATDIVVSGVTFRRASASAQRTGLRGFVSATLDGWIRVHGFTVRRTRGGVSRVFPPEREDKAERLRRVVELGDAAAEQAIERKILAELVTQGILP